MDAESRKYPNIVITGTPGCGKSTLAQNVVDTINENLAQETFKHINVSDVVKKEKLYASYDSEMQTYDINEDATLDYLEKQYINKVDDEQEQEQEQSSRNGGALILDWHICDIYPERWVDLVVVLRCDHSQLWTRLEQRKYPLEKIKENNEAEIMQVILDEAKDAYEDEIIVELYSETNDQLQQNTERIVEWIHSWMRDRDICQ